MPPATGRVLDYQSAFAEVNGGGGNGGGGGGGGKQLSRLKENAPASVLQAAANAAIKRGWDKAAKGKANHLAYAEVNAPAGAVLRAPESGGKSLSAARAAVSKAGLRVHAKPACH